MGALQDLWPHPWQHLCPLSGSPSGEEQLDVCISFSSPFSPGEGAVCGAEHGQQCWRSLAGLLLCADVAAAGRNSEFLRGHSCHSSAGAPSPPRSRLQRLLLKTISMAPLQAPIPFHTPGVEANPPSLARSCIQSLLAAAVLFQNVQDGTPRLPGGLLESRRDARGAQVPCKYKSIHILLFSPLFTPLNC